MGLFSRAAELLVTRSLRLGRGATIDFVSAGGEVQRSHLSPGQAPGGQWIRVPSVFRLRLTGTGTVTMDARDSLGNVTTAVETYSVIAATDQIEFPYAGDDAVNIRLTLTGSATAEVL